MNSHHILQTLSTLSITDITGKKVISIVKKHTESNGTDKCTTEIYFRSAEAINNEVLKLIKY